MSADKDRGIRREKQKRAKQRKRLARQQHQPGGTAPRSEASPSERRNA